MKIKYTNEDSGKDYTFFVTLDYCSIEGASFVASSEDGVHEVDGKGHCLQLITEALDDYFWELDQRPEPVGAASKYFHNWTLGFEMEDDDEADFNSEREILWQ